MCVRWQIKIDCFSCLLGDEWPLYLEIELDDAQGHWTTNSIEVVSDDWCFRPRQGRDVNNGRYSRADVRDERSAQRSMSTMTASESRPAVPDSDRLGFDVVKLG